MKKDKKQKNFRMFILVQEEEMQKPRWIETDMINLGSLNNPNRVIKQIRIEPIEDGFASEFMDRLFRGE